MHSISRREWLVQAGALIFAPFGFPHNDDVLVEIYILDAKTHSRAVQRPSR